MLKFSKKKNRGQLLPAYPLFVKDPFFSIWSGSDKLNESDTMFWTGASKKMYGYVFVENKPYLFMGVDARAVKLTQTFVDLAAFDTRYGFTCDDFDLEVTFTSPLPPDDLELLSCPVCYFRYKLTPKRVLGKTKVVLVMDEEHCYDNYPMPVRGGKHVLDEGTEVAWFGLKKQLLMSQSYDDSSAEWGYYYLSGKRALCVSQSALSLFVTTGDLQFAYDTAHRKYLIACDPYDTVADVTRGMMTVSFDDTCSIHYFGDWLRGYYFDVTGKTILQAIEDSICNADQIFRKCNAFDTKLKRMAKPYGEDYLLVLYGGLRQTMAAHKLVMDRRGTLLFLSKENHSNGCIATVDVSYPSIPLFLLFNPALVRAMCEPIFRFARMDVWKYDFAPHDVGTYPYCCGQIYGLTYRKRLGAPSADPIPSDELCGDGSVHPALNEPDMTYTYPLYYAFSKNHDLYKFEKQMPVEECGNMLIMIAAALLADGEDTMAKENWDLLTQWVVYLVRYGLMPGSQLCTDDFAGHLDKNINLSVKAIVGIESYAIIAEKLGHTDIAAEYHAKAKEYATEWKRMCYANGKTPLVFDDETDSFSLKYNMAFDVLFGTDLFDAEVREHEVDRYLSLTNRYGVPLDSRSTYTKSDWILWTTSLTSDLEKRKALIAPVARFLRESESRYPFVDWYYSDKGTIVGTPNKWGRVTGFKNRSVQGGLFITLRADAGICKKDK